MEAYPGHSPVITGAELLQGDWTVYKDPIYHVPYAARPFIQLFRLVNRGDLSHEVVRKCPRTLRGAGDQFAVSPQNVVEFWNVSTRPSSARGGYGLSVSVTEHHRLKTFEEGYRASLDRHGIPYEKKYGWD